MTYNILDGGKLGIDLISQVIVDQSPDFLTINEANTFAEQPEIPAKISESAKLPYYHLALSGEQNYHVAVFSKYPFQKIEEIKPLMRAGILAVVEIKGMELAIVGTHLTPYTEDLRL